MRSWRRNQSNAEEQTFDPSRLNPKATAQLSLLKELLDTMLPPQMKLALSPMLSPMLRQMDSNTVANIVAKIREIGEQFSALDKEHDA